MRNTTIDVSDPAFLSGDGRDADQWIEVGALRLPRGDIVACRIEDVVERDAAGKLASLGLILAAALVMLMGLIDLGWQTRLVLGAGVLGIVAVVSGMEALGITRSVHYRLDILMRDGRRIGYTTASRREAEGLAGEVAMVG